MLSRYPNVSTSYLVFLSYQPIDIILKIIVLFANKIIMVHFILKIQYFVTTVIMKLFRFVTTMSQNFSVSWPQGHIISVLRDQVVMKIIGFVITSVTNSAYLFTASSRYIDNMITKLTDFLTSWSRNFDQYDLFEET